jgi:hypothetical protein
MTKVVSNKRGSYCHLKLDDGGRILVEVTPSGLKISKLRLHGVIPTKPLCDLDSQGARSATKLLTGGDLPIIHLLETIKHKFLDCRSLEEAKRFCYALNLNKALSEISSKSKAGSGAELFATRGAEKRSHERHQIPLSGRYVLVNNARKTPISPVFNSRVRDVSLGGISIANDDLGVENLQLLSESLSHLATMIKIKINLPDQITPVDAVGQIVHGEITLNEGHVSMVLGTQFVELNADHNQMLRKLVDSQTE